AAIGIESILRSTSSKSWIGTYQQVTYADLIGFDGNVLIGPVGTVYFPHPCHTCSGIGCTGYRYTKVGGQVVIAPGEEGHIIDIRCIRWVISSDGGACGNRNDRVGIGYTATLLLVQGSKVIVAHTGYMETIPCILGSRPHFSSIGTVPISGHVIRRRCLI